MDIKQCGYVTDGLQRIEEIIEEIQDGKSEIQINEKLEFVKRILGCIKIIIPIPKPEPIEETAEERLQRLTTPSIRCKECYNIECTCICSVCEKGKGRLSEGKLYCLDCVKCRDCKKSNSDVEDWVWLSDRHFFCRNCFKKMRQEN
jgi:hypothetical protein